jgi:uncharacterized membrane protein
MLEKEYVSVSVRFVRESIELQIVDVVVNPANSLMAIGGGLRQVETHFSRRVSWQSVILCRILKKLLKDSEAL